MIEVEKKSDNEFLVVVKEGDTKTKHIVILDNDYYKELSHGKVSEETLIKESFQFLLEREPKESILSKFNLKTINTHFPEFEQDVKRI